MKRKLLVAGLVVLGIGALGIGLVGGPKPDFASAFITENAHSREIEVAVFAEGNIEDAGLNVYSGTLLSKSDERIEVYVPYTLASDLAEDDQVSYSLEDGTKLYSGKVDSIADSPRVDQNGTSYRVVIRSADLPDRAKSGMGVEVDFANSTNGTARFLVSEFDLGQIEIGQPVVLSVRGDGSTINGKVTQIDTQPDLTTGVVKYLVTAKFDSVGDKLRDGMSVNAKVAVAASRQVLAIPASAVTEADGQATVQVLQEGLPVNVAIEIGVEADGYVEVLSGLSEGDAVVTGSSASQSGGFGGGIMPPAPGGFGGN